MYVGINNPADYELEMVRMRHEDVANCGSDLFTNILFIGGFFGLGFILMHIMEWLISFTH